VYLAVIFGNRLTLIARGFPGVFGLGKMLREIVKELVRLIVLRLDL